MKQTKKTSENDPTNDRLKSLRSKLEVLGVQYRELLSAYGKVLETMASMGACVSHPTYLENDLKLDDFSLGLMALKGDGPLRESGANIDLVFHLVAGSSVSKRKLSDFDIENGIPF